jgi:type I restriction enzyme S subunit
VSESGKYALVPLSEVLVQDEEYITEVEPRYYPKLSVKLYGRGVVLDDPADGATVRMKRHQLAKPSQVILSEIWAKKGAIGIVPEEGDGALITSHFFLFDIDESKLLRSYMRWLLTANYFEPVLGEKARGTTGYAAIRPRQFLSCKIPLPPLNEQCRIVARIEELAALIQEAQALRVKAQQDVDALSRAIIFDPRINAVPTPMSELVALRKPDVLVQPYDTYHFAGVYSFGRGVFQSTTKTGAEFSYQRLTRLATGNFVYPKLMAWEGAFGTVPPECDGLVVSTEFPVFEVNEDKVLSETLDVYFRTPAIWELVAQISTGTNVRRRRLHPNSFLSFEFPLPPLSVQIRLREVNQGLVPVRQMQRKTAAELEALLPSVLDRAFKGEL